MNYKSVVMKMVPVVVPTVGRYNTVDIVGVSLAYGTECCFVSSHTAYLTCAALQHEYRRHYTWYCWSIVLSESLDKTRAESEKISHPISNKRNHPSISYKKKGYHTATVGFRKTSHKDCSQAPGPNN